MNSTSMVLRSTFAISSFVIAATLGAQDTRGPDDAARPLDEAVENAAYGLPKVEASGSIPQPVAHRHALEFGGGGPRAVD